MGLLRIVRWRWLRIGALAIAAVIGLLAIGLALYGLPAPPAIRAEDAPRISWKWVWKNLDTVRRIQASRRFAGWLPGQTGMMVHVGTPGAVHIVDRAGAEPTRLEGLPDRARFLVHSRFTERPYFVFSLDEGGSERYVHYRFDLERRTYQALTPSPARSYVGSFDGDGRRVIYASARRNKEDFDLYVVDVTNPSSDTRVLEADGEFFPAAFSPDGRSALAVRVRSHTSRLMYLLDLETRGMRPLFDEHGAAIGLWDADWSRDNRTLYLATELDREFTGVHAVDPASGHTTFLTPDLNWDVDAIELLSDDRTLALLVNTDGRRSLYLLDTVSRQLTEASVPPAGDMVNIVAHPVAPRIAIDVISPAGIRGVWTYEVADDRFSPWAVSDIESSDLPAPTIVRYPTFDSGEEGNRRMIPAVIFGAARGFTGRRPVMIDIHGGPAMQAMVSPAAHYQLMRQNGVTIIAPNVRGSRGYGRRYEALDDRERREDAVRDIGALLEWVATQPNLDPQRVGVMGGSYGGYMTLASLVHYSDRLRCGLELFGISNFVTFLEASQDSHYPEAQRSEFGDERDPTMRAFLESISPARRAERVRVPLMIFQGANDVRVKPQESRQMVERIRAAGGRVTYLEAADEGHGLEQPLNLAYFGALAAEFTERCLGR